VLTAQGFALSGEDNFCKNWAKTNTISGKS